MTFLARDRDALARLLPGFDEALAARSLAETEAVGHHLFEEFRSAGGPGLLVPEDLGGLGAAPVDALRVQRAIGSRSPSVAVATTMHHFSVATLVEMIGTGLESLLVEGIARSSLLVASGFAEGLPGQGVLAPTMSCRRTAEGLVVRGSKKPCSLAASMDLITVSVQIDKRMAVVMVPRKLEGIEHRPFWRGPALGGAESDEVVLNDVVVPERLVSYAAPDGLDAVQTAAFLWFELLITASYVGVASGLVERLLASDRGGAEVIGLVGALEAAMAALEGAARPLEGTDRTTDDLARALLVRYQVQRLVVATAADAAELLGGNAFFAEEDVGQLLAASRALAFHPPSRASMTGALGAWLTGGELVFPS